MVEREVLVDNDLQVVSLDDDRSTDQGTAMLSWSLLREVGDRRLRVEATGPEPDTIAFDLRVDLLTDPVGYELTRGMVVQLHSYRTVESVGSAAACRLRSEVAGRLRREILDRAYTPPQS